MFEIEIKPTILTIITTYKCTAACEDCCFECSPKKTGILNFEEIKEVILNTTKEYPSIKQIVFTGGECFILKKKLFDLISISHNLGLKTRCVTNAYWAKNKAKAQEYSEALSKSGIDEINISTGHSHQQWINENTVINAIEALLNKNIFTLVTIETDRDNSDCINSFKFNSKVINLQDKFQSIFYISVNIWVSEKNKNNKIKLISGGCEHMFNNIVISPDKKVISCCGLTNLKVNEFKIGDMSNVAVYREEQKYDFLKLWIKTEGAYSILNKIGISSDRISHITHPCEACDFLYNDSEAIKNIKEKYTEFIIPVINSYNLQRLMKK
ncbi:radical SAM protein [Photobacterium kishitanii]|uniref:Radical SAM protein n=1 Tax=Photobacterium kishitanii TaxID=318456 RepID=A0AAX0YVV2_9GAMM|nr:radical SAM protein [Photobacterium kishitanii]PSX18293.1 radical SAM protein [Photobacterium kishitanii]PSX26794.1 radical SAM protein [Photobacterium kishitanii]PSX31080.1 radical SAM protein [Photobacterium kishitanii]PSX43981.1 radical SAM protein [Photobacterium kishitanii]